MKDKKILVIVTGSIAAYKSCEVIRLLTKSGANVRVMMSQAALEFIGKSTFAALTNNEVITKMFPKDPKAGLEHINLAIELDAIIVVPATANVICKVANGICDDVVSTTLSICEQPTLFAPAMNFRMWQNPATSDAIDKLRNKGSIVLDTEEGQLASLHEGEGRLPSINNIMNGIRMLFNTPLPLENKKIIVTAGPTRENIDPVRFISNRSSGKMGFAIAKQIRDLGGSVILISGPVYLPDIPEVKMIKVESSLEMQKAVLRNISKADYIFMAAAVSDYTPSRQFTSKMKRSKANLVLDLEPAPDILKCIIDEKKPIKVAFALETDNGEKEALRKMKDKKTDFIILNYANEDGAGFDSNTNRVTIFNKNGQSFELKKDRKDRIAKKIIEYILKK